MASQTPFKLKLKILCGEEIAVEPGKADLLEAIAKHHAASAAGRAMGSATAAHERE